MLAARWFDDANVGRQRFDAAYNAVIAALPAIHVAVDHRTAAQYNPMSRSKQNPPIAVCQLLFQKRALQNYTYHAIDIARCRLLQLRGDLAVSEGQCDKAVQYYLDARDAFIKAKHPADARLCDLRARWIQHQHLPLVLAAVTFGVMCLASLLQLLIG